MIKLSDYTVRRKEAGGFAIKLIAGWVVVYCLTGCGTLHPRNPLPAEFAGKASLPGYVDIRDWGDHFSPVLQRSVETAMRAGHGAGRTSVEFLALSGGGMNGAFGAGFLCGWTAQGSRPTFDFVTGISAGALLAPFAFAGTNQDPALRVIFSHLNPDDSAQRVAANHSGRFAFGYRAVAKLIGTVRDAETAG